MTQDEIWDCDKPVAELLDCAVPGWIERDIEASTIAAICHGGCASGAYMPAVTYSQALRTMGEHGDEVLKYIEDAMGELPAPNAGGRCDGLPGRTGRDGAMKHINLTEVTGADQDARFYADGKRISRDTLDWIKAGAVRLECFATRGVQRERRIRRWNYSVAVLPDWFEI